MPNAETMAKDSAAAAAGHSRRFSMLATKVSSTTATTLTTITGKKPQCVVEKESFNDWPNSEGVSTSGPGISSWLRIANIE